MAVQSRLLSLPLELREMIWAAAAANGAWTTLAATCKQIKGEIDPHCKISDQISEVLAVQFYINPSYERGTWYTVEYMWQGGSRTRRVRHPIQDVNDPIMRVLKGKHISCAEVELTGPTRGHFFGAFLMMFAKASEVMSWLQCHDSTLAALTLTFKTSETSGKSAPARSFWECRFPGKLLDQLRNKFFKERGMPAYCYEYFLGLLWNTGNQAPSPRFLIQLDDTIKGSSASIADASVLRIFDIMADKNEQRIEAERWMSSRPRAVHQFTLTIQLHGNSWTPGSRQPIYLPSDDMQQYVAQQVFHGIQCDVQSLQTHLGFYLDHHTGPIGGPLDLLRLQRFKTMHHDNSRFGTSGGITTPWSRLAIASVQRQVSDRLIKIFDPVASRGDSDLRFKSCKHIEKLRCKPVASAGRCSNALWAESYPRGISYNLTYRKKADGSTSGFGFPFTASSRLEDGATSRRTIAHWRNEWRIIGHPFDGCFLEKKELVRTWDCITCCREALFSHEALASKEHGVNFAANGLLPGFDITDKVKETWPFDLSPEDQTARTENVMRHLSFKSVDDFQPKPSVEPRQFQPGETVELWNDYAQMLLFLDSDGDSYSALLPTSDGEFDDSQEQRRVQFRDPRWLEAMNRLYCCGGGGDCPYHPW